MHVSDIETGKGRPDVIAIAPDETMEAAAQRLHNKHIGAVIVGSDGIAKVMQTIRTGRFRHVPVIEDDKLMAMVGIGDVVKHRLEEAQQEAEALWDYVLAGH